MSAALFILLAQPWNTLESNRLEELINERRSHLLHMRASLGRRGHSSQPVTPKYTLEGFNISLMKEPWDNCTIPHYDMKIFVYDLPSPLKVRYSPAEIKRLSDARYKLSMWGLNYHGPNYIKTHPTLTTSNPEEADLFLVDFNLQYFLDRHHFPAAGYRPKFWLRKLREYLQEFPYYERRNANDHIFFQTWEFGSFHELLKNSTSDPLVVVAEIHPLESTCVSCRDVQSFIVSPFFDLSHPWSSDIPPKKHLLGFYGSTARKPEAAHLRSLLKRGCQQVSFFEIATTNRK